MEALRDELKAWRQSVPHGQASLSMVQGHWLSLAEDYMSVLIHRPGLTFDPTTQPFSDCLRICTAACIRIIRSATSLESLQFAPGVGALLSSLVFQCALMIFFNRCHASSREGTNTDDVSLAIAFLTRGTGKPFFTRSPQLLAALSDAVGLLQSLSQASHVDPHAITPSSHANALINSTLGAGVGTIGEEVQLETPTSIFDMDVDGSNLGELGQLDSLDWIFDFNPELPPISR